MELPTTIEACHLLLLEQQKGFQHQLDALYVIINDLQTENKELRGLLNSNSKNSSKPPSTDGFKKSPAIPKPAKLARGGQKGHKGDTLKKMEHADEIVELRPNACAHCEKPLPDDCPKEFYDSRQVLDIPPIRLVCKEYKRVSCKCACGAHSITEYPQGVLGPIQYGPRFQSLVVMLHQEGCMAAGKISALFGSLFSQTVSTGTLHQIQQRASSLLEKEEQWIANQLMGQKVVHGDESGIRVAGKLQWLHTLCDGKFTLLFAHEKRGYQAHENTISFLPKFKNRLIHDFWKPYFNFSKCKHAICMAHIIRELNGLIEQGNTWASGIKSFLFTLYEKTSKGTDKLSRKEWLLQSLAYDVLIEQANKIEPIKEATGNKGRPKQTKARNLLNRLTDFKNEVLAFAKYRKVPFTNNMAERAVRPCKSKLKIAGCFRASIGAQAYTRTQGFISTVKKHQQNPFEELVRIFKGETPLFKEIYS